MQTIAQIVGKTIGTLAQPTRDERTFTKPTSKLENYYGFKTFGDELLGRLLVETANFCVDMRDKKQPRWLSLLGTTGSGKTHLAKRIWRYFDSIAKWHEVEGPGGVADLVHDGSFYDWRTVASELKGGNYGLVQQICDEWFVVLDDIGAEHDPSGFIASSLDRILNTRLKKWTVITSNLTLSQIAERMDVRIASRMLRNGGKVIDINTLDFNWREQ